jgi:hypothetical protein
MVMINHMRRFAPKKQRRIDKKPEPFAVNSFMGSVDPAFDELEGSEEQIVEKLRDRGTF